MKQSVFIPLAFEFDPDKLDSLQESFGVSENEFLAFMMKIGRWVKESNQNEDDRFDFAQRTLVPMLQNGEVSPNLLLLLASNGAIEFWDKFASGILLILDAEQETKDKNDAS